MQGICVIVTHVSELSTRKSISMYFEADYKNYNMPSLTRTVLEWYKHLDWSLSC